jgi:GntR family negative regulator for fad regulon and positive regulator of fabA
MPDWPAPEKPAQLVEDRLIRAILDGTFPANSTLPGERDLAQQLGVTRPTLREALQRLAGDGWIEIHHGKPTRVRDVWTEGNLTVLAALVRHQAVMPATFVPQLLEIRGALAPLYGRLAVVHNADEVAAILNDLLDDLSDTPESFASTDWQLHHRLTVLSANPIYTLMLNGFAGFYEDMARLYFCLEESRESSRRFYHDLREAAQAHDPDAAEAIVHAVMQRSIALWERVATEMTLEEG